MSFVMTVPASKPGKTYTVRKVEDSWTCDCQDHVFRSNGKNYVCKHIAKITRSLFDFVNASAHSKSAADLLEL